MSVSNARTRSLQARQLGECWVSTIHHMQPGTHLIAAWRYTKPMRTNDPSFMAIDCKELNEVSQ